MHVVRQRGGERRRSLRRPSSERRPISVRHWLVTDSMHACVATLKAASAAFHAYGTGGSPLGTLRSDVACSAHACGASQKCPFSLGRVFVRLERLERSECVAHGSPLWVGGFAVVGGFLCNLASTSRSCGLSALETIPATFQRREAHLNPDIGSLKRQRDVLVMRGDALLWIGVLGVRFVAALASGVRGMPSTPGGHPPPAGVATAGRRGSDGDGAEQRQMHRVAATMTGGVGGACMPPMPTSCRSCASASLAMPAPPRRRWRTRVPACGIFRSITGLARTSMRHSKCQAALIAACACARCMS